MPGTGPVTKFTECFIADRAKDIEVEDGKWAVEFAPYCFRCEVWIDPDVPHVPLVNSTHESIAVQPDEPDLR